MTPPRPSERSAIPLPDTAEPLVERAPISRQSRRQERRAQAKAARRRGPVVTQPLPTSTIAEHLVAHPVAVEPPAPPAEPVVAALDDPQLTPLPRHRALTKPRSRAMVILDRLFRGPFRRRRPIDALPPLDQLRSLRDDLARVQGTIDRLLDQVAPA
ncbi:hypothetical protein [Sphingomonas sp. CCH10-B3]|uniref:hypothetical protein n=1 Tax=Sphingomonas sp. CCH10-B3 TaxID=1768757 RepID=UPI00082EE065|nr:hypothetical protein [Sphingomonas sp. CCH10-B3]